MKKNIFFLLAAVLIFSSCKKGDIGPEGPAGVAGPAGPTGNANVQLYSYPSRTVSTGIFEYKLPNMSKGFVDSCLVLPSFEVSSTWYPVPGGGVGASYDTRYFLYQDNPSPSSYILKVFLYQPNTTIPYMQPVTWDRFKIIFAPANIITVHG